ncbi:hypothetical protein DACRYDRAFT_21151 [Dacryopinax primogenitus]|uniref:Nudix hydrolase domain-containing protein n=1 Tax=Dacryopinax primogenitus (strain DJM 731) TaxID=1858805 RepID=M5G038_DACPD|nr:uncharacterized protein DACRYDRAFT_21151 [Dacryopinax primogenitus]EJU03626.1 hypothetical protein DACRYDRAFT_21151 [Dacryopinax primogenitus]
MISPRCLSQRLPFNTARSLATSRLPGMPTPDGAGFPIDEPLSLTFLAIIRHTLRRQSLMKHEPPFSSSPVAQNAAVLVPLCNVNGNPGILFEVRGKLRSHAGEVSFPGGRTDEEDDTFLATAIRETDEEIGVGPGQIEVLGTFGPAELSLWKLRVHPFVGFIYPTLERPELRPNEALPSIALSSLRPNPPEVSHIFHLTFREMFDPHRLRVHDFRGYTPYWAIDVSDKVEGLGLHWKTLAGQDELGGSGRPGGKGLEIWGLTGWYLNVFLKRLGLY